MAQNGGTTNLPDIVESVNALVWTQRGLSRWRSENMKAGANHRALNALIAILTVTTRQLRGNQKQRGKLTYIKKIIRLDSARSCCVHRFGSCNNNETQTQYYKYNHTAIVSQRASKGQHGDNSEEEQNKCVDCQNAPAQGRSRTKPSGRTEFLVTQTKSLR